jgi:hypothetical protein
MKSGSLNLLEPSGPVQVCNGIALAFKKQRTKLEAGSSLIQTHTEYFNKGTPSGHNGVLN